MKASTVLAFCLSALLFGTLAWSQAQPPGGGASVSGTSPLSVSSGVVSMTEASASTSGYMNNVSGRLVVDAGITINTPSEVPIVTNSPTFLPIIRDLRSGAGSHVLACLGDSVSNCYYPIGVDLVAEEIFVSQAASVTTRFRDRSNTGIFSNVGFAGPAFSFASSGGTTKVLHLSGTAPTTPVSCTSPTITHGTTASFQADVGTGCAVATFAFTVPATTNGTRCTGDTVTNAATHYLAQTGGFTGTTVTMTKFVRATGVAGNFADGEDIVINCAGR